MQNEYIYIYMHTGAGRERCLFPLDFCGKNKNLKRKKWRDIN
jgi:hypothetical protein